MIFLAFIVFRTMIVYRFVKHIFGAPCDCYGNPLDVPYDEKITYSLFADENYVIVCNSLKSHMTEELLQIRANLSNKSEKELMIMIIGISNLFNKMDDCDVNKKLIEIKIGVILDILFDGCDQAVFEYEYF